MSVEEAKHLSEVLKAFSEGNQIQERVKLPNGEFSVWYNVDNIIIKEDTQYEYRIKPDLVLRPYNDEIEFLGNQKEHGPYIKSKKNSIYEIPTEVNFEGVYLGCFNTDWESLLKYYTWQDGSPCGIEEI